MSKFHNTLINSLLEFVSLPYERYSTSIMFRTRTSRLLVLAQLHAYHQKQVPFIASFQLRIRVYYFIRPIFYSIIQSTLKFLLYV